ncbi:MAG: hypothetical protein KAR35_03755 [Candidatus Heimdallarchaeota archaeon]|nr:hypothetical protein [Candidatus Heimdallarchaeota archaeon]MCK5048470.1 hypothetical protein [Candidatus Heimdallarchaeota archaeon]
MNIRHRFSNLIIISIALLFFALAWNTEELDGLKEIADLNTENFIRWLEAYISGFPKPW